MKQIFVIDNSEKTRILEMHENATKKMYLGEQVMPTVQTQNFTINQKRAYDKGYGYRTPEQADALAMQGNLCNTGEVYDPKTQLCGRPGGSNLSVEVRPNVQKGLTKQTTQTYTDQYVKQAQQLLGQKVDGKFGPETLKALQNIITRFNEVQKNQPIDLQSKNVAQITPTSTDQQQPVALAQK